MRSHSRFCMHLLVLFCRSYYLTNPDLFRLIIFQVRPDFRKLGDKIIFLNGSNGICGVLASQLQQTPTKAIMTSVSKERTLYEIRQRFNAGSFYAERLIRTQTNHFENETEFIAYQEIGIDKYYPPLHSSCRQTVRESNMNYN